ncbi:hypothetical protein GCM10009104_08230 [Marinobacterium maritimum]|uniref:DUF304 domain-containing protein n=1 Tax=Marinobacterium maritimum TaxID=500162 RepID=A0ABN1I361_9GAMM
MRYRISTSYYRKQTASHLLWMLFLAAAVLVSLYYLFEASTVADFILPVLGVAACSAYFIKLFRHLRLGRQAYPEVELSPEAKTLAVIQGESRVEVDISHILNLKLQFRGKQLEGMQVTTGEGEVVRLEGYEDIAALGEALEQLTPDSNVTRSRLRIR